MRTLITTFFLFLYLLAFSQSKGIKCTYMSTMPVKKGFLDLPDETIRKIMLERIRDDRKVYSLTVFNGKYLFSKAPSSIDKMPLEVDIKNIFINFNDSTETIQSEYNGKLYITKGKTNRYDWDIAPNAENIQGRTCYKATLKSDTTITSWFTTDIPLGYAPLGFHGLPGLVIRLKTPVYTLDLQDIVTIDATELKEPEQGKAIAMEKYKKLIDGNYRKTIDNAKSVKVYE